MTSPLSYVSLSFLGERRAPSMGSQACHPHNKPFFDRIFALKQSSRHSSRTTLTTACSKVLESLSRYPLPLTDLHQISALDGVGSLFARELEIVLKTLQTAPPTGRRDSSEWKDKQQQFAQLFLNSNVDQPPTKKPRTTGLLQPTLSDSLFQGTLSLPAVKSGAFSLLVSVLLFAGGPVFSGHQIVALTGQLAQLVPDCAAVTSRVLGTLTEKGWLTAETEKPPVYRVTETGWQVANRLRVKCPSLAFVTAKTGRGLGGQAQAQAGQEGESAQCRLLVCPREISRGAEFPGEPRPLPLGDFAWVWSAEGDERFGGVLVERKSVQDLASSIIDGRYDEQKGRIMRVASISKVIFIIEEDWLRFKSPAVSPDAVRAAMRSIQLISGFQMITSRSIEHSAEILKVTTQLLAATQAHKFPTLPSFAEFSVAARKSADLTVKDVTLRMLLTVRGLGPEAVAAISDVLDATFLSGTTFANLRTLLRDYSVDTIVQMTKESRGMKRAISSKAIEKLKLYLSVH